MINEESLSEVTYKYIYIFICHFFYFIKEFSIWKRLYEPRKI